MFQVIYSWGLGLDSGDCDELRGGEKRRGEARRVELRGGELRC